MKLIRSSGATGSGGAWTRQPSAYAFATSCSLLKGRRSYTGAARSAVDETACSRAWRGSRECSVIAATHSPGWRGRPCWRWAWPLRQRYRLTHGKEEAAKKRGWIARPHLNRSPACPTKKPRWLPGLDGGAIPALTVAEFSLPRCALTQCAGVAGSERILCDAELSEVGQGITRITRQFPSVQPIMGSHPIGKAPGTPVFGVKVGSFVNTR